VTAKPLETTLAAVRRLGLARQLLSGAPPPASTDGIVRVAGALGRIQLDPTAAVARSHLLVLWSRLGPYDPATVDLLLGDERRLFEHRAFIRTMDQLPMVRAMARHWPSVEGPARAAKIRGWMAENASLSAYILDELSRRGPLASDDLEDRSHTPWRTGGYFDDRNVGRMLEFLEAQGRVAVSGRRGSTRLWDLPERCRPAALLRREVTDAELLRDRVERAARALGVAKALELQRRGRLPGLPAPIDDLVREGRLRPVTVTDGGPAWRGLCFVHADDAEALAADRPVEPRTTLLSPFDNLIDDRDRVERLYDFRFRNEIYVPAAKRQYGYFVMPILHGERLIGRLDPHLDRARAELVVNALQLEPAAPDGAAAGRAIATALASVAQFVGAASVRLAVQPPAAWTRAFASLAG
jgi:hypothetical protein